MAEVLFHWWVVFAESFHRPSHSHFNGKWTNADDTKRDVLDWFLPLVFFASLLGSSQPSINCKEIRGWKEKWSDWEKDVNLTVLLSAP